MYAHIYIYVYIDTRTNIYTHGVIIYYHVHELFLCMPS